MAKRSPELVYVESMITFLYDNTRGLEAELNAAQTAMRVRKVRWIGKGIGKREGKKK